MDKGQEQERGQIALHEPPPPEQSSASSTCKASSPHRAETSATENSSSLSSLDVTPDAASTDNDDSQRTLVLDDCGGDDNEALDCRGASNTRKRNEKQQEDEEEDPFDESVLADLGFMMEGARASEKIVLEWIVPVPVARRSIRNHTSSQPSSENGGGGVDPFRVQVVAHTVNEEPGAVQSGHYLWPGARILVDYLVNNHFDASTATSAAAPIASVVELGAGCAVATLACLQLHQSTIQVAICTDHDPGVLERARDSYESTMEYLFSKAIDEDELNDLINCLASIPVLFEPLEWGSASDASAVSSLVRQHTVDESDRCDLVLGSDLIYSADVIAPLLTTASLLMKPTSGRFILSQSFSYDEQAEAAMVATCEQLSLERTILWQDTTGEERVQEFRFRRVA